MNEIETANNMAIALGLATFQAQALEYSLVSLHAVSSLPSERPPIQSLMDTRYKQTLGKLITDAFKQLDIPDEIKDDLEKALLKRNWVTHHFFREYGMVGLNSNLQIEATEKLSTCYQLFERVSDQISSLIMKRYVASGRTEEEIMLGSQKAIEDYLKEKEA